VELSGPHTFLFTDIENSVRLWDASPDAMSRALCCHDGLVQRTIRRNDGLVFARTGDGFGAVFSRADGAFEAAVSIQDQMCLTAHPLFLGVRIGIHTGTAERRSRNYYGPTVNHCARLTETAKGGQILASGESIGAADMPVEARCLGEHWLRDLSQPLTIYEVGRGLLASPLSIESVENQDQTEFELELVVAPANR
jgi:class 3 adenylate cyclase